MIKMLLQIDFPYTGPWGEGMSQAMLSLARDISHEPGLVWKIWTENQHTGEAGGIYIFNDEHSLDRYLEKHTARLQSFGISNIRARKFYISDLLTEVTHGPLDRVQLHQDA